VQTSFKPRRINQPYAIPISHHAYCGVRSTEGGQTPGHSSFFSRQYELSRGLLSYRPDADVTLTSYSYPVCSLYRWWFG